MRNHRHQSFSLLILNLILKTGAIEGHSSLFLLYLCAPQVDTDCLHLFLFQVILFLYNPKCIIYHSCSEQLSDWCQHILTQRRSLSLLVRHISLVYTYLFSLEVYKHHLLWHFERGYQAYCTYSIQTQRRFLCLTRQECGKCRKKHR